MKTPAANEAVDEFDAAAPDSGKPTSSRSGRIRAERNMGEQESPAKKNAKAAADAIFSPKADAPAAGEPGHNVFLGHDQSQNLLLYTTVRKLRELTVKKDKIVADIRNIRKTAKADGLSMSHVDRVMKEMGLSQEEIIEDENKLNSYRAAFRLPFHPVMDAHGEPKTPEDRLAQIETEGLRAGLRGASQVDNPHEIDTEAGARWLVGYDQGQKMLLGKFKPLDSEAA